MPSLIRRHRGKVMKAFLVISFICMISLSVDNTDYIQEFSQIDNGKHVHLLPPDFKGRGEKEIDKLEIPRDGYGDVKMPSRGRESEHGRRGGVVPEDGVEIVHQGDNRDGDDSLVEIEDLEEHEHDVNAPGEQGQAIKVAKELLSPVDRKKMDEGWKNNAYNQYASDMMSLHRSLPDVRDEECKAVKYHRNLPATSVIVCFHNEAWSVLLRTVHSIIDKTPPRLLKEIILVDDFSDMDHLKQPLQDYIDKLGKVKVTRTPKREGLIRARLQGFQLAAAEVVTFLDSHCECAKGWLEPLLDRIYMNESTVVCPVIDGIDATTMQFYYQPAKNTYIAGFDWNLQFTWHAIPDYERKRRHDEISPIRSPTMAGGLFVISKKYFQKLGTYDPGMDIWGGENLELSFKVWMCGGTLEIIPCSHVGHIFRERFPYTWKTGVNVVKKNSIRLAEVWMDDYKQYYYERFNYDLGDYGDVTDRKRLRNNLHCKPFSWYLKNVYPDLFIPEDVIATGEIRSASKPVCIDSPTDHLNVTVNMYTCHNLGGNQFWILNGAGEIRRDTGCLDYSHGDKAIIYSCHDQDRNQKWEYREDNTLRHVYTGMCAEVSMDGKQLMFKPCTGVDRQRWLWKRKSSDKRLR